jgi:hypothetical protein
VPFALRVLVVLVLCACSIEVTTATAAAPAATSDLKLVVQKPIQDTVGPGATRTFSFAVYAVGSAPAPSAKLTIEVPRGARIGDIHGAKGPCTSAPIVVCPLGDMQVGDRIDVTAVFMSAHNGRNTIAALAGSASPEATPANNAGTTYFVVDSIPPDLTTVAFSRNTFLYEVSENATITLTFDAGPFIGKRRGVNCVRGKPAKGQSCHYVIRQSGEVVLHAKKGENRFKFNDKVGGRTLKLGAYIVRLSPKDNANNVGVQRKKTVTLLK